MGACNAGPSRRGSGRSSLSTPLTRAYLTLLDPNPTPAARANLYETNGDAGGPADRCCASVAAISLITRVGTAGETFVQLARERAAVRRRGGLLRVPEVVG